VWRARASGGLSASADLCFLRHSLGSGFKSKEISVTVTSRLQGGVPAGSEGQRRRPERTEPRDRAAAAGAASGARVPRPLAPRPPAGHAPLGPRRPSPPRGAPRPRGPSGAGRSRRGGASGRHRVATGRRRPGQHRSPRRPRRPALAHAAGPRLLPA
jgi:hypothetical protein